MSNINKEKDINYTLIFANKSCDDIILYDKLKDLEKTLNLKNHFLVEEVR